LVIGRQSMVGQSTILSQQAWFWKCRHPHGLLIVKSYRENIKKQEKKLTSSFYKNGKPTKWNFSSSKLDELFHSAKCSLYILHKFLEGMRTCKDMMKMKINSKYWEAVKCPLNIKTNGWLRQHVSLHCKFY
jgi:hypothetical protein